MLKEDDKVNEVMLEEIGDPRARTGNCYGCGQVGHFFKDCTNPDKFECRKENHPYPPNKGSAMDWHLNTGAHGKTAGLMGTILNNLQKQEKEKRGLLKKYKKTVKLNKELQASVQESAGAKRNRTKKTTSGATTATRSCHVKTSDDNPTITTTLQNKPTQTSQRTKMRTTAPNKTKADSDTMRN